MATEPQWQVALIKSKASEFMVRLQSVLSVNPEAAAAAVFLRRLTFQATGTLLQAEFARE